MESRSHESPMDFQWNDKDGPRDPSSPFPKSAHSIFRNPNGAQGSKRPFSIFGSDTPSTPLRQSVPSEPPLPTTKPQDFRTPSFTHVRDNNTIDFSSGPENLSSPEHADNEDTPEPASSNKTNLAIGNGNITLFRGSQSPKKETFTDSFSFKHSSPSGRGEIPKRQHSDALVRKVHKRRRRDINNHHYQLTHRRPSYDSDSEQSHSRSRPSSSEGRHDKSRSPSKTHKQPPHAQTHAIGVIPSLFTFLETHPQLPHILSFYAQLVLNVFLIFSLIYIIYSFYATILSDINQSAEAATAETLAEMASCAREFTDNRCDRDTRVPAMEIVCDNWERCMRKDPKAVGRAKVSASTFAEIFNGFIEPISYKAMVFSLVLVFGCVAISNFAFGFFRTRAVQQQHHQQQQQYQHPFVAAAAGGSSSSSSLQNMPMSMPVPSIWQQHQHSQQQQHEQEQQHHHHHQIQTGYTGEDTFAQDPYFTPYRHEMENGRRNGNGNASPSKRLGYH
ncbi:hypothetical protein MMC09_004389 [Bachmanniomyces sp. S44760]|nr:hypothetical protein [Bachmanniomyces sp. S44760]